MFRKCCGYYCAMVACVALFFYGVIIAMEVRQNQFVMWKMQFPEGVHGAAYGNIYNATLKMKEKAHEKIIPLVVVLGLNLLCIAGCLFQVKLLEKKEEQIAKAN
jgi:hypothetical protein